MNRSAVFATLAAAAVSFAPTAAPANASPVSLPDE
jgi:hypothetical protein